MRKSRKSALSSKKQNHIRHLATKHHVAQMKARIGNSQFDARTGWASKDECLNETYWFESLLKSMDLTPYRSRLGGMST